MRGHGSISARKICLPRYLALQRALPLRHLTTQTPNGHSDADLSEAWLFVDSVLPVRVARWDLRHYVGAIREETLLDRLQTQLSAVKTHNFNILALEPHYKDGGVFVKFQYSARNKDEALAAIENDLREEIAMQAGPPSWMGLGGGNVWLVKGKPWREDMNRFASPLLKLSFDGPDIPSEEALYALFRPYGPISNIAPYPPAPVPAPAGVLRSTIISFYRLRSATIARNVAHSLPWSASTRIKTAYEKPLEAHAIRNWLSSHPRIVLPVIVFLFGTLTYAIFDPIRSFMVQAKVMDWFDYREFKVWKWLRAQTFDRLSTPSATPDLGYVGSEENSWKERKDAQFALRSYLSDMPTTVAFVYGPQGSGKSRMVAEILRDLDRKPLFIDCTELVRASTDADIVARLARQTGYWPVFTFLNSMNTLIDVASVGLIGQKTGLSSSLEDQLKQVLEVVGRGLQSTSQARRVAKQRAIKRSEHIEESKAEKERRRQRIKRGTWHDGRLDCVAGNGVMSELGVGDELLEEEDTYKEDAEKVALLQLEEARDRERKRRNAEEDQAIESLPIVMIRNFGARGGANAARVLDVLAQWGAGLAENKIAHVVVISESRENTRRVAKALPTKALNSIVLSDADPDSALSFIGQKVRDAGLDVKFTSSETAAVRKLGGRVADLDSLVHKLRGGQPVEEAVADIINRGVGELRKNAFGDDAEEAKSLPWTKEQVWTVLKRLSKESEISYHDVLLNFPFKGDEAPLKSMEHAELIIIGAPTGYALTIRPGKPMYQYVFKHLVEDRVFQATQDILFNEKVISSSESTVRASEEELEKLKALGLEPLPWWSQLFGRRNAAHARARYLLEKMLAAEMKIEALERKNSELKKVLMKEWHSRHADR